MRLLLYIIFFIYPLCLNAKETTILFHHNISLGDNKEDVLDLVEGQHRKNDECIFMGEEYDDQLCPKLIDETIYRINGYKFNRTIKFNKNLVQQIELQAFRIKKDELNNRYFSVLIENFLSSFKSANSKYKKKLLKFKESKTLKNKFHGKDCNFNETIQHKYSYENSSYRMYISLMYDCNDDDIEDPDTIAKAFILVTMSIKSINQLIEESKTVDSEL